MKKIEIDDENLINIFFKNMDNYHLQEVKNLVEQGGILLNPVTRELEKNCIGLKIYTNYFDLAFYLDEDKKSYQVGDQKLAIASRRNPYEDSYQYICIEEHPMGSDGWDFAMAWDPNSEECYGANFRVYQLKIEVFEDEWEEFPIWFEDRESATIYLLEEEK